MGRGGHYSNCGQLLFRSTIGTSRAYPDYVGFFMRLQGDQTTGAGHAGLMDMLNDIFAPGKEHLTEQQQYDERVGRKVQTQSGKPLDFNSNEITLAVPKAKSDDQPKSQ